MDLTTRQQWMEELRQIRSVIAKGDNASKEQLAQIQGTWVGRKEICLEQKDESLALVNENGELMGFDGPRWLFHLLGLRHRCAHILLLWNSPGLGEVAVLQVRDWEKSVSPGEIDISVGGHVTDGLSLDETACKEMIEELGLHESDLENGVLKNLGGYDSYNERDDDCFHNAEWRQVYIGRVSTDGMSNIKLPDGEVAGVYLCPLKDAKLLLSQPFIQIANGLESTLPYCLDQL
jgi:isopentenyldiphosphate isomerase